MPERSAAFWIHVCMPCEPYARSALPPADLIPSPRRSHPARDVRAAQKPSMLATLPPLTSTPLPPAGNPTSSAIHRTDWASISLAIGESGHPPTFGLIAEANMSASTPSGAGPGVM